MHKQYVNQVQTLIEILPFALADKRMALKGGTAINLFYRDLPRLSVDIDLCYLPLEDRQTTFRNIHQILGDLSATLTERLGATVTSNFPLDGKREAKLHAVVNGIEIKIEPNYIIRGSLFEPQLLPLSQRTSEKFQREVKVNCLSIADTYGGKICAALDRQHPRDLFDVKLLLENEGIITAVKESFMYYLLSHNRPINEVLDPRLKDITQQYNGEFSEMSFQHVTLDELESARVQLIADVNASLTEADKVFLLSFVSNDPDWARFNHPEIQNFPSVKWKLFNQKKMNSHNAKKYNNALEQVLYR